MVQSQQIDDFISRHRPKPLCGRCIAEGSGMDASGLRSDQIAAALGRGGDFNQETGVCGLCGKTTEVICRY